VAGATPPVVAAKVAWALADALPFDVFFFFPLVVCEF
jgi:hypothetical protein